MTRPGSERLTVIPAETAALVIECQNDLIHESRAEGRGVSGALARAVLRRGVLDRIREVLDAARRAGVPVLYATIENRPGVPKPSCAIYRWSSGSDLLRPGSWGAQVHDAIAPLAGDHIINRHVSVDPSYGSSLFPTLHALGRRRIIIMGVSTNFAVEGTVRGAVNRMLDVIVVEDGCASAGDDYHEFAVTKILPLLATVTSAAVVVEALAVPC
jgi:nicotinamidase-related amidase